MTNEELLTKIREAAASKATALDLSGEGLTNLPPELFQLTSLTTLDLSGNQLATLPPELFQLTSLTTLDLSGNPLVSPPIEIINKGIEAIREYFATLNEGTQPLNEVKLILVGDGAAGKTSLVKRLFGQPFDEYEDVTHVIRILGWDVEVGGRKIKINIWDFGGQEIMHATHQFFLSKRSLYVLVLDGRKDEHVEYWLRYIEAFGGDSPVLVVLNKQDANPGFDLNRPFLLQKYASIKAFFRTSCKTGQGIAQFKKVLLNEASKIEMTAIRWPQSWFTVKQRIEQMGKPYISADDYKAICNEAGITEEPSRETLVDFLHDLGVAVHFNGLALNAMQVLDPVWVTNAVYKIINAEEVWESGGILAMDSLPRILNRHGYDGCDYPASIYRYILELMKQFELCYDLHTERVLIPQLLPVVEPDFAFDYSNSLCFALHYHNFLPPSVFPRFMVKVHRDIKDNLRWRTGVVLEDVKSGTQAVVKADHEVRRINIWVQGEGRREYLHYLRYTLADINSSFEKLTVSERVPMPDEPYITADYQTLLKNAVHGIERYFPEGANKAYSVRELLGLVQPKDEKELDRLAEKLGVKQIEKESLWGIVADTVEIKILPPFINFNVSKLFKGIRSYMTQRQQKSRN